jgi:hypothetical protein
MASQQQSWPRWALDSGQALYCKPQRSRPTRAQGTAGKQCIASPSSLGQQGHEAMRVSMYCFSASASGLSQQGLKTLQASYIICQQAPAVLANKGTRHCWQVTNQKASQMAVAPQGLQHCEQANLMYSKPQRSWPTRA